MGFHACQDFSSFPSDELLDQVDDSVLSEFICDVFHAKTLFAGDGRSWNADACKGHMCASVGIVDFIEVMGIFIGSKIVGFSYNTVSLYKSA